MIITVLIYFIFLLGLIVFVFFRVAGSGGRDRADQEAHHHPAGEDGLAGECSLGRTILYKCFGFLSYRWTETLYFVEYEHSDVPIQLQYDHPGVAMKLPYSIR